MLNYDHLHNLRKHLNSTRSWSIWVQKRACYMHLYRFWICMKLWDCYEMGNYIPELEQILAIIFYPYLEVWRLFARGSN